MHTPRAFSIIFAFIFAFSLMLVPKARADEWDQASKLTFNQPLRIPGNKILAAGTYWFVTMADFDSANVVRVFNADRTRLDAVIPSAAIERRDPSPKTEINIAESQGNEPKALVSWFYPGSKTGHEFIYNQQEEKVVAAEPVMKVIAGD